MSPLAFLPVHYLSELVNRNYIYCQFDFYRTVFSPLCLNATFFEDLIWLAGFASLSAATRTRNTISSKSLCSNFFSLEPSSCHFMHTCFDFLTPSLNIEKMLNVPLLYL